MNHSNPTTTRTCLRVPISEIADAARLLDAAVTAHLLGHHPLAEKLIYLADMPSIREWTESIWGRKSPYVQYRNIENAPPTLSKEQREKVRMPTLEEKSQLHLRDGYHCRFCSIPVIRKEVRARLAKLYPHALLWGKQNIQQHAAFQAMWAQYDHVLPHARGGNNDINNLVITCAPCNFGRMNFTLDEVGLIDPRTRPTQQSNWDGLQRI